MKLISNMTKIVSIYKTDRGRFMKIILFDLPEWNEYSRCHGIWIELPIDDDRINELEEMEYNEQLKIK